MGKQNFIFSKKILTSINTFSKYNNFVIIGVNDQDDCIWASSNFEQVYSISSDIEPYSKVECPNVVYESFEHFSQVVEKLEGKTVFIINSLPIEESSKLHVISIQKELEIISKRDNSIIIINNAEYLGGPIPYADRYDKWPTFDEIFTLCKSLFPDSFLTLIDGTILCVPNELKEIISAYWLETFNDRFYLPEPTPERRSLLSRIKSRSRRILKDKIHRKKPVAYNIRESLWFENELNKFKESHKWLLEYQFKSIVDIGANVGQFGKKIRQYYPEAHLYSFEPIPFVYEELKLNFKDDPNFTPINVGVGDSNGKTKFHLNLFSDSSSMLEIAELHTKNFPQTKDEIEIDVVVQTLDESIDVNKIEKPYLVKIDVQGFEEQVINGGTEIISNADMIITESSYKELYKGQALFGTLYDKLNTMGFEYIGNLEQLESAFNGEPLQGDAIFVKKHNN